MDRDFWNTFNVLSLLLSVSVITEPRKLAEKIMFLCLLLVSARYGMMLYGSLLELSFDQKEELNVKTEDDIDKLYLDDMGDEIANLTNEIAKVDEMDVASTGEGRYVYMKLRKMMQEKCLSRLINDKNYVCSLFENQIETASFRMKLDILSLIKQTGVCEYFMPHFTVHKRSPYAKRIQEILLRIEEAGLPSKWDQDHLRKSVSTYEGMRDETIDIYFPVNALLIISVTGLSLALLVFIIEIVLHRIKNQRRPQR